MSDNISKYVAAISNKSNFDKVNEEKNKYDQEFANNHISNTLYDMHINSHAENGIVRVYPQHINEAKKVLSKLGYTYKVVGTLKEDLDESSSNAKPTVKTGKYSWGTMKTIHHGHDFSIPLHPEHQEAISNLEDGQEYKFKDETGARYSATRKGLDVHFKGHHNGNETKIPHKLIAEDLDEGFKYDVDHMVGNLGYRPISGQLETKKDNVYATYGTLERAQSVANKHGFIVKKHSYIDPYDKKTKFEYHVIKESLKDLTEEELMELDKKTLASYIKRATSDHDKQRENVISYKTKTDNIDQFIKQNSDHVMPLIDKEKIYQSFGNPKEKEAIAFNRAQKRGRGIRRATDRLVKESNDKDIYGNPISAREKLYRNHQNIRKKAGLPDPNYYLELAKKKKQELEQMQDKVNK